MTNIFEYLNIFHKCISVYQLCHADFHTMYCLSTGRNTDFEVHNTRWFTRWCTRHTLAMKRIYVKKEYVNFPAGKHKAIDMVIDDDMNHERGICHIPIDLLPVRPSFGIRIIGLHCCTNPIMAPTPASYILYVPGLAQSY